MLDFSILSMSLLYFS